MTTIVNNHFRILLHNQGLKTKIQNDKAGCAYKKSLCKVQSIHTTPIIICCHNIYVTVKTIVKNMRCVQLDNS